MHDPVHRRADQQDLRPLDELLRLYSTAQTPGASRPPGTRAVPISELAAGATTDVCTRAEDRVHLKDVLAARPAPWPDLDYVLEFLVRPIVITCRGLLVAGHLMPSDPAIEITPDLAATGRVVLPSAGAPRPAGAVDETICALHERLRALATALARLTGRNIRDVNDALDGVVAQELRHLAPATAALLNGNHPWHRHVHTVHSGQNELLRRVIDRVASDNLRRRHDPTVPRPVVVVDLDFCGLHPRHRVREALRRVGVANDIDELANPDGLRVLPGLYPQAWHQFVACHELDSRYPDRDWNDLYAQFRRTLSWAPEALRTDESAPGLVRFLRDVELAGGHVAFVTGRRESMRTATQETLARHGIGHVPLCTQPAGEANDVAQHKVRALQDIDGCVVAAFDDLASNRDALRNTFPETLVVAVHAPGFTHDSSDDPVDGAHTVETFERIPHPTPLGRGHEIVLPDRSGRARPRLSHATSIAELRTGEFSTRPTLWANGLTLTADAQSRLIDTLCASATHCGQELGRRVLDALRPQGPEATARALREVILAKPFGGAKTAYSPESAERDMVASISAGEPIRFVMVGPPTKQDGSRLKALGSAPDLAEAGLQARILQLDAAVRKIHPPGISVRALADPSHFRYRAPHRYEGYHHRFAQLLKQTGANLVVSLTDIDDAADEHPGCGDPSQRSALVERYRERYRNALAGLDIRRDPPAALAEADALDPRDPGQPRFVEMFRSVLHTIAIPQRGADPLAWSQRIYADPFELADASVSSAVREARADVLAEAWQETITYLANKHVDRALNYDALWERDCVRMSLSIRPAEGRFRFVPLGGSGVMPWHGTGAINDRAEVSVDYAISLAHQGFVPIYPPDPDESATAIRQPWLMVPPHLITPVGDLDPVVFSRLRLRSK